MSDFTPFSALIGGILIGVSTVLLMAINGKIAGISGILYGTLFPQKNDFAWRLLFLIGLIGGSSIYFVSPIFHFNIRDHYPTALLLLGGFLVGFGTRLGGGCTSGHAVCGVARLSLRSTIATCFFIFSGMLAVYVLRHLLRIE